MTATASCSSKSSSTSTAPSPRSNAHRSRLSPRSTASPRPAASQSRWRAISSSPPAAQFEAETMAVMRRLADGPTAAYAVAKRLINEAAGVDRLYYHLDRELESLARIADTGDFA